MTQTILSILSLTPLPTPPPKPPMPQMIQLLTCLHMSSRDSPTSRGTKVFSNAWVSRRSMNLQPSAKKENPRTTGNRVRVITTKTGCADQYSSNRCALRTRTLSYTLSYSYTHVHIIIHSVLPPQEPKRKTTCRFCNKRYSNRGCLEKHERSCADRDDDA